MKEMKKMDVRLRYALVAAIFSLTLLLVGAGKMSGSIQAYNEEIKNSKAECQAAVDRFRSLVPAENQKAWDKVSEKYPEFCLRVSTSVPVQR